MNMHTIPVSAEARSDTLNIGILETGSNGEEFVDRHGTFGDWFVRWLGGAGNGRFRFTAYRACDGQLPERASACDAYVITGSAASVTEQADWMKHTQDFVQVAARDRPVVGICFGHQLVADAYGGTVERCERGWGIGVHTYDVHRQKPWMTPASRQVSVVASHMDQVVAPPPGSEVLAGSDFCPVGMLQIGDNLLTFQTHPEITKSFARDLYSARTERLGAGLAAQALASLDLGTHSNLMGTWITQFIAR
jgi:GMP synthase-like glutamine amidotransferase